MSERARAWLRAHGWYDPSADEVQLAALMLDEIERLKAERDGYRNGQLQVQATLQTVMESNTKMVAERWVLVDEINRLKAGCKTCAGWKPSPTAGATIRCLDCGRVV